MSATREHANAGKIDDAIASVGAAITVAEHLLASVAGGLPVMPEMDYEAVAREGLAKLREAQLELTHGLGI